MTDMTNKEAATMLRRLNMWGKFTRAGKAMNRAIELLEESAPDRPGNNWARSWCPQCGPGVFVDEDGCCRECGATATGPGADAAVKAMEQPAQGEAVLLADVLDILSPIIQSDGGDASPPLVAGRIMESVRALPRVLTVDEALRGATVTGGDMEHGEATITMPGGVSGLRVGAPAAEALTALLAEVEKL